MTKQEALDWAREDLRRWPENHVVNVKALDTLAAELRVAEAEVERFKQGMIVIPEGCKVSINPPPMPESELVHYLNEQIARLHKDNGVFRMQVADFARRSGDDVEHWRERTEAAESAVARFGAFFGLVSREVMPDDDNQPMETVELALKQLVDDNKKHIRQTWALGERLQAAEASVATVMADYQSLGAELAKRDDELAAAESLVSEWMQRHQEEMGKNVELETRLAGRTYCHSDEAVEAENASLRAKCAAMESFISCCIELDDYLPETVGKALRKYRKE